MLTAQQSAGSLNESAPDTARVQAALNGCAVGQAVEFSASGGSNAFLIAPITLPAGVTMLLDAEVTLFGSIQYADYGCSTLNGYLWCNPLITVAPNSAPAPGSAIMGYGIIDGRGGWSRAGISGSWWSSGGDFRPRLVFLGSPASQASADNFTLYKTTLQNSPMYHLTGFSDGLIVWGAKVTAPSDSPNTDGIDPLASSNITITKSYLSDGDDFVSMKDGFDDANLVLGTRPVTNVTISNMNVYTGHGFSVGSQTSAGMSNILITNAMVDNVSGSSQYTMRVKSAKDRGGEVKNVLYQNLCINHGGNTIYLDPYYNTNAGTLYPNFHDITIRNVHQLLKNKSSRLRGFSQVGVVNPLIVTLDNVVFDGSWSSSDFIVSDAQIALGPGPVSFASSLKALAGSSGVVVTDNVSNNDPPYPCSTSLFVYLAGELFAKAATVSPGNPLTLTAIVQPMIASETSGGAAASAGPFSAPTGTLIIYENQTQVASASLAAPGASYRNSNQRSVTYITIPSVSAGAHTYTASYSGDGNYAALNFGSFTVTGQ